MDYIPRHPQPFTLAEATRLEVPVITEEIARLQNSLNYLQRTQDELKEHLTGSSEEDAVLEEAYTDNSKVIASQKERITILKMALSNKGMPYSNHYDASPNLPGAVRSAGTSLNTTVTATSLQTDDGGIDL
ncbi:hypothetical protein NEOLEDRAFT_1245278, partial [Neolentinus lepideus HHB14362 ss-1]